MFDFISSVGKGQIIVIAPHTHKYTIVNNLFVLFFFFFPMRSHQTEDGFD